MHGWFLKQRNTELVIISTNKDIDYINDSNDGLEVVLVTGWEKDEDAE